MGLAEEPKESSVMELSGKEVEQPEMTSPRQAKPK